MLVGVYAQQIKYQQLDIISVWWQEVYLALLAHGRETDCFQFLERSGVAYAYLLGQVFHAIHAAIPYDILYADVIADERFLVVVYVNDTYQSVSLLSEVI